MTSELLHAVRGARPLDWPRLLPRAPQWRSAPELGALQRRRLQAIVARAGATEYYARVLREAGMDARGFEPRDLCRLPLLDKQTLARHGHEAFLNADLAGLVAVQTSGSTGTPGRFYRSWREETAYSARWMRVYAAYGCRPWDAQVNVAIADKPDRKGAIKLMRRVGLLPQVEKLASDTPPSAILARLQTIEPPILTGYAGAIEGLAEHVLATGARITPPRAVFCTAMEVTSRCLELAEQAFQAPAVDVYVTNEFGVIAWSCPVRRDVMHVNDDDLIVEVLGPDGTPTPQGVVGELVITSLRLGTMPLIRYRMGDMAARIAGSCECGRGLGLMTRVQGRTAHVIRRPDGSPITTPYITSLFGRVDAHDWIRRFQVREEAGQRLRFLLDARHAPSGPQWENLTRSVTTALSRDFRVEFEFVEEIPAAPSGKLQFLVPLRRPRAPDEARLAS